MPFCVLPGRYRSGSQDFQRIKNKEQPKTLYVFALSFCDKSARVPESIGAIENAFKRIENIRWLDINKLIS